MSDLRVLITGAAGRMGRTLIRAVAETSGLTLAARSSASALWSSARTRARSRD